MKIKLVPALVLSGLLPFSGSAFALTVTTTNDANLLASTILGSGISISNITYTGNALSAGTFSDGAVIGMSSGILLTSGNANLAVGPNTNDASTGSNGLPGDANLNSLIPSYTTYDATILEFDFVSAGGDVYFNYVFGSEEYNEWVNSPYNDVFGFFLDGQNIALIPATTTAVSINNVNSGSNAAYYNNNDPSDTTTPFDIGYDGFTDVFTAQFIGLSAGTHHIKLAIADAGDSVLDSGVFIQAGSFSDTPTNQVSEPAMLGLFGLGLLGLGLARRRA